MNNPENLDAPLESAPAGNNDLPEQYAALRQLFIASLVGLLLLAMSVNYLILRQLVFTRKDLAVVRPQVAQMVEGYTKSEEPQIRSFVNNLIGYAKVHPDFVPILAKYKIVADTRAAPSLTPAVQPSFPAPATKK